MRSAFGQPGIPPTWTSSAKDLVSTALGSSRLWATFGYGIVNEIYWPATSDPQIRDMGFILARDDEWIELKRAQRYAVTQPVPTIPAARIVHEGPRYRFTLEAIPDPRRDVLLISYSLEGDYQVYALLAPHLGGSGLHNTAWVDGAAFGSGGGRALALVPSVPFSRASAGYVGASDGWQDFDRHGRMTETFDIAEDGNVALLCELATPVGVLALGFNDTPEGARTLAATSLAHGFVHVRNDFEAGWREWADTLTVPPESSEFSEEALRSATVLKVHEDRTFPGAIVASLSIPWGNTSDSRGGYHLVWTRDAVEAALALLVIGQRDDAASVAAYLASTQLPDGHWHQNFYPDGRPFWDGVQMDEVAFPILLVAKLREDGSTASLTIEAMVRRAAAYIASVGPMSPQDRWEENPGANPFTLGLEVAALVASSTFLDGNDAAYVLSLADYWNERIEEWCYLEATDLARRLVVSGYYVRVAPTPAEGRPDRVDLKNRAGETVDAGDLVGLEFMYLPRLGLRRADDPRIVNSLRVVDALLRVETPAGPLYHRYNEDGYGEHEDGRPFDGTGVGRLWPLLTGERGHLALAAGEDSRPYLETILRTAGPGGLLPEQVWDGPAIPERGLFPGKPSGSAMPLVWAHAEFLKLLAGRAGGRPCERLRVVEERYRDARAAETWHWRADTPFMTLPARRNLLIEEARPFTLHYGFDGWHDAADIDADDLGLGMYGVRFPAALLAAAGEIEFTRRFGAEWEAVNYAIAIAR
jgi:glucoamylase